MKTHNKTNTPLQQFWIEVREGFSYISLKQVRTRNILLCNQRFWRWRQSSSYRRHEIKFQIQQLLWLLKKKWNISRVIKSLQPTDKDVSLLHPRKRPQLLTHSGPGLLFNSWKPSDVEDLERSLCCWAPTHLGYETEAQVWSLIQA